MKATGIVRRIDELGRVVIPKEIRRTLRIREGDALEIYTDREGGVILRKYSLVGELGDFSREYAESLHQAVGHIAVICDKDAIVACASANRKDHAVGAALAPEKPISDELESAITARRPLTKNAANGDRMLPVTRGDDARSYTQQLIVPIVASGDPIGAVILLSREPGAAFSMADIKVAETAASFLGRQLEN
ncbi:MAG: AbrB/MazE/SpoVT family DNA-binding domain-containing protein [Clostridia bacterium]|nr:AbrB/MazE/SpoVT family DNA-binding domain-containing protein [Clostridia bacterium]